MRRWTLAGLAATIALGTAVPVASGAQTTLTPIPGSPFTTLGSPYGGGRYPVGLALNPAGTMLVTANFDASLSEFSVGADGTLTQLPGATIGAQNFAEAVAWSPTGTVLAVTYQGGPSSGMVAIFTRSPGSPDLTLHQTILTGDSASEQIAFSPDGDYLVLTGGLDGGPDQQGSFGVYRVANGGTATLVGGAELNNNPQAVAFSPSGDDLAVGGGDSKLVNVYSVPSLTPITGSPFPIGARVGCLAYNPIGTLIAGCAPHAITLDAVGASGALSRRPSIHSGGEDDVAWSPDGALLAAANPAGSDAVYALTGDHARPISGSPFPVAGSPGSLQFSPDGDLLATTDDSLEAISQGGGRSSVTLDAVSTAGG